jgi:phenylalanyl-tRNA synthetase beta subunit
MKQIFRPIELPTSLARKIAIAIGLHHEEENLQNVSEYEAFEDNLAMFQQMAISTEFEKCLSVYEIDIELTDDQREKLKYIYDHTNDWIRGHISGELMKKLSDKLTNGRDANEIAKTITELSGGGMNGSANKRTPLIVRMPVRIGEQNEAE